MTGAEFEANFIARCVPMQVNATLPADQYAPAMAMIQDATHHADAMYCGCDDAKFYRNGREVYSRCDQHHVQPCGTARRMRRNHLYAR